MTASRRTGGRIRAALAATLVLGLASCGSADASLPEGRFPWHTDIVATTFWVGELFDPNAEDGSQLISAYDVDWFASFGGCDGIMTTEHRCGTEVRTAANGFFPNSMAPLENPFYLDVPFDDIGDDTAFGGRGTVVPWANDPGYAGRAGDRSFSFLKNRWVHLVKEGRECYGQIEDAGPGQYHDSAYVFGTDDARPANIEFNGAGMDVSPALNGCLGFRALDGDTDTVDWRFVDDAEVPDGPWKRVVTTSPVSR